MITLTKDMETGVAKIDSQHKELVNRINDVLAMGMKSVSIEETQKTIDLLNDYVVKHFSDEEALHKRYSFPKLEWHQEQHKTLLTELQKYEKEFEEDGASAKFTIALNNSIVNWIVRHIKHADVEFGKYYREQMNTSDKK